MYSFSLPSDVILDVVHVGDTFHVLDAWSLPSSNVADIDFYKVTDAAFVSTSLTFDACVHVFERERAQHLASLLWVAYVE